MKLINKISIKFFFVTLLLFILFGFVTLYVIKGAIESEIDEELATTSEAVVQNIKNEKSVVFEPFIEINKMDKPGEDYHTYKDTLLPDEDNEAEQYRELISYRNINGSYYKITVRTSSLEQDDLFDSLLTVFLILTPLLLISLYFVNRSTAKQELRPFYRNLEKLKSFSLKEEKGFQLERTTVKEFKDLNETLEELISRAVSEYKLIIESSENLSHELQTPIAVIKSKLELLIQNEELDPETAGLINSIENQINRLSKINRSLILLMKLENKEMFETESVNLNELIEKHLEFSEDIIKKKSLSVNKNENDPLIINMNRALADILIGNLISNSCKHNYEGGQIEIETSNNHLVIKNTGNQPATDTGNFFNRFGKDDKASDSVGLGLSIVKQICNFYNFSISYIYSDPFHTIRINFISQ
ncbi:MAG: HAMP domain-containing histidine kinase [Ignavibacteriae bacterium]|nr:HAMP domain-containing histidine kinase [Ignavibacteriota bacterium]MCB9243619.1 HAMP domain-containing histidine kinase [Ignavibacteriales bacterium]